MPRIVEIDGAVYEIVKRDSAQFPSQITDDDIANLICELCRQNGLTSKQLTKILEQREEQRQEKDRQDAIAKKKWQVDFEKRESDPLNKLLYHFKLRHTREHHQKLQSLLEGLNRNELLDVIERARQITPTPRFTTSDIDSFLSFLSTALVSKKPSEPKPKSRRLANLLHLS